MSATKSILVAEDEPQIRQLHYMILTGAGYEVDLASDGQAAWDLLKSKHYDLLVTDNSMPRMKGVELIRKIAEKGIRIPIILASACLSRMDESECQGLNVSGRLTKPFGMNEFLGMIKSVLGRPEPGSSFARLWQAG